jgi:predicted SAM-dependent methyltransferase
MKKLHVACGRYSKEYPFEEWVNLDWQPRKGYKEFVKHDATKRMTMFEDEVFEVIFSEHFVEHLDMSEATKFALEAKRMLKPGGVFRTVVPDAILRKDEPPEKFPHHQHKTAWTYQTMRWLLEQAGFTPHLVQYWDELGEQHWDDERMNRPEWGEIRRPNSLIVDGIK